MEIDAGDLVGHGDRGDPIFRQTLEDDGEGRYGLHRVYGQDAIMAVQEKMISLRNGEEGCFIRSLKSKRR